MTASYRMRKISMFFLATLLCVAGAYLASLALADEAEDERPDVTFSIPNLDGRRLFLEDLRGKVVVIHYWATWCADCIRQIETIEPFYLRHRDDGLELIALSMDDNPERVRNHIARQAHRFQVDMATLSARSALRAIDRLPTTFVIDKNGIVRSRLSGPQSHEALQAAVHQLLVE